MGSVQIALGLKICYLSLAAHFFEWCQCINVSLLDSHDDSDVILVLAGKRYSTTSSVVFLGILDPVFTI